MPHILVFDSGIGGTSVLTHIQNTLPGADYTYIMDNALLPYGLQSEETIQSRLTSLVNKISSNFFGEVDLIVIACNTASTYALAHIRQFTQIPIVGVVPAIKPAAQISIRKHIALLATPATSKNQYTQSLVSEFAQYCQVSFYHSTELVRLAERKFWLNEDVREGVNKELSAIKVDNQADVLILGCTHFPILKYEIAEFYQTQCVLIDSGTAIAKRVQHLLAGSIDEIEIKKPLQFYATALNEVPVNTGYDVESLYL
ncbi:glutamate racemase [Pseudoalteromonas phenolica]|uniref:Glutamate racemase n=1 Tax=Pseudoalteromonas phenolica TaxID=161398 RepID=A0A5S3YSQ2_9GAMM|nr:glutamate racemase [Pseudoalteromonas phenolica]TMP80403.1 glutamate racemase [Pseudoalteromonas phenolica]